MTRAGRVVQVQYVLTAMPSFKPPLMCCMAFHVIVLFRITRFRQGRRRFKQAACGRWIRARGGLQAWTAPQPGRGRTCRWPPGAAAGAPRPRSPPGRGCCVASMALGRANSAAAVQPAYWGTTRAPGAGGSDAAGAPVAERARRRRCRRAGRAGGAPRRRRRTVHGGVAEQAQPGGVQGGQAGETTASRAAQELLAGEHRHCGARKFGSGRIGSPGGKEDERNGGKKYSRHRPDPDACPAVRSSRPPARWSHPPSQRLGRAEVLGRWVFKILNDIKDFNNLKSILITQSTY